jgi:hypothetical protein
VHDTRSLQSINVCDTFISPHQFYSAQIKKSRGEEGDSKIVVLHVHAIEVSKNDTTSIIASQYLRSQDYFFDQSRPDEDIDILLTYTEPDYMGLVEDAERFDIKEFVSVLGTIDVLHTNVCDRPGTETRQTRICRWAVASDLRRREIRLIRPAQHLLPGHWEDLEPLRPEIYGLTAAELYSGAGGTSCGFAAAEFEVGYGVEEQLYAAASWQVGCQFLL